MVRWAAEFKRGQGSIEDDPPCGREVEAPTPEFYIAVKPIVMADRRLKKRRISETVVYPTASCTKAWPTESLRSMRSQKEYISAEGGSNRSQQENARMTMKSLGRVASTNLLKSLILIRVRYKKNSYNLPIQ